MGHEAAWVRDFIFIGVESLCEEGRPTLLRYCLKQVSWTTLRLKDTDKSREKADRNLLRCGEISFQGSSKILSYGNDIRMEKKPWL